MNQDPIWLRIVLALVQAGIGAASALIAVHLTQRSAHRERQQRLLERLYEPHFTAHREIFVKLVDLQDELKLLGYTAHSTLRPHLIEISSTVKRELIWLDESVANQVMDILERIDNAMKQDSQVDPSVRQAIVESQRAIRDVLGIPDFVRLVNRLRNLK